MQIRVEIVPATRILEPHRISRHLRRLGTIRVVEHLTTLRRRRRHRRRPPLHEPPASRHPTIRPRLARPHRKSPGVAGCGPSAVGSDADGNGATSPAFACESPLTMSGPEGFDGAGSAAAAALTTMAPLPAPQTTTTTRCAAASACPGSLRWSPCRRSPSTGGPSREAPSTYFCRGNGMRYMTIR